MLALAASQAGAAVRALAGWDRRMLPSRWLRYAALLPQAAWSALASSRAALPSWMAQAIGREADPQVIQGLTTGIFRP